MKKITKSLLLGTAAGLVAVAGAQAADMPVKAAPVQYVKICSLYGDGFYYIPGTDTCLKLGGYLRVQAEYNMGGGGVVAGDSAGGMIGQGRFDRATYQRHQLPHPRGDLVGHPPADRIRHAAHLHPLRRREHHAARPRLRHHRQPVLGPRVHPVRGLHGGPVTVVLRPLHLRRRLQLPQRARLRRHRRRGPEPLGLYRPVRQRLLRHHLARRPREPQVGHLRRVGQRRLPFDPGRRARRRQRVRAKPFRQRRCDRQRLPGAGLHRQPAGRSGVGLRRHQRCLA